MILPAIAAAVGIVGTVAGFVGSRKASRAAKRQAKLEAQHEREITAEKLRQLNIEQRAEYGSRIAEYVGSGVVATTGRSETYREPWVKGRLPVPTGYGTGERSAAAPGSVGQVIAEQEREYGFERAIIERVGATKVSQSLAAGRAVADRYRYSGIANVASGISSTLSYLAESYDWGN